MKHFDGTCKDRSFIVARGEFFCRGRWSWCEEFSWALLGGWHVRLSLTFRECFMISFGFTFTPGTFFRGFWQSKILLNFFWKTGNLFFNAALSIEYLFFIRSPWWTSSDLLLELISSFSSLQQHGTSTSFSSHSSARALLLEIFVLWSNGILMELQLSVCGYSYFPWISSQEKAWDELEQV